MINSMRPSLTQHLPSQFKLAGRHLEDIYLESVEANESRLSFIPGKKTLGVDGHRDGESRVVETVTDSKLTVSTFKPVST